MSMDIQRLKFFCAVAKYLNFSKAAEECHIAQTAMSRSIASLEGELGFRLFNRTHHYVELTPAGAYFLAEASKIVESYEFAKQSGGAISKTYTTKLDIGFGGFDVSFARYYVGKFMQINPQCSVVFREYHYDDIFGSLLSGTSDIIFTPMIRVDNKKSVHQVLISNSPYVIAAGESHPLSCFTRVIPSQLNGMDFIVPSDVNISWKQRNHLIDVFDYYGIKPGRVIQTNSANSVTAMLGLGLGITLVSADLRLANRNIVYLGIDFPNPMTKRHVTAHMVPVKRPIIQEFMDFIADHPLVITEDG